MKKMIALATCAMSVVAMGADIHVSMEKGKERGNHYIDKVKWLVAILGVLVLLGILFFVEL